MDIFNTFSLNAQNFLAMLKAQVSLQLGKMLSSDNVISVSISNSHMY